MSAPSSEGAEPNLTPILDMVFQLITFFMLVINFKGAQMDLSLKLPVLGSARPIPGGEKEPMTLNIDKTGKVKAYGAVRDDLDAFLTKEARLARADLKQAGKEVKDGELPVPIMIRADQSVPFRELNRVIKTAQEKGFRQFQLSAMSRAEKAKEGK